MKKGTMKKSVSILLALLLILSLQLAPIAVFAEADSDSYIEEVVRLVNIERANEGLSELTIMEDLCNAAQVRAEEIVELLIHVLFTPPQNVSKLTVLPVQLLMDIMSISS